MRTSMGEILDLKTIHDYNRFLGLETLNPLVSFVDFSKVAVCSRTAANASVSMPSS